MAALSYLLGFITGIVILVVEKEDKFIRFHAMQSTVVFGSLFVFNLIVRLILAPLVFLGVVASLLSTLISIAAVIIWIISMVRAYQGQMFKWPIVGDFAERQTSQKNRLGR